MGVEPDAGRAGSGPDTLLSPEASAVRLVLRWPSGTGSPLVGWVARVGVFLVNWIVDASIFATTRRPGILWMVGVVVAMF